MTLKISREQLIIGWKKWEKLFLSVETLLIVGLGVILYADFQRRLDAGVREQIGVITFKQKTVQRKYSGRAVWEPMENSFPLYNRDSIRTGDLSDAEITLNDGTKLEVDENTLIVLNISKEEKEIDFAYGNLTASRVGDDVTGEGLSIKSGENKIALNNANVSLSQTDAESLMVDVKEGIASLFSGEGEKKEINSDERVELKGDVVKVQKKPFRVIQPPSNYRQISGGDWINLTYEIDGWEPGTKANLEFSRSRNFGNIISKRTISSAKFTEPFKPGIYYWRVIHEGKVSSIGKVSLIQVKPSRLVSPPNGQKIFTSQEEVFVSFSWTMEEGVSQYAIEVAQDESFANRVIEKNTMGSSISTNLKSGNYFWRVRSVIANNIDPVYSKIQTINISNEEVTSPPSLFHPKNNDVFSEDLIRQSGISFFWKPIKGYSNYELEISRRADFSESVNLKSNGKNNLVYKEGLDQGDYYWRVRGITPSGSRGSHSIVSNYKISKIEKNVFNLQSDTVVSQTKADREGVLLKWKKLPINGTYEIILATDSGFNNVIKKIVTNLNQATIKELLEGKYYWKVSLLDDDGKPVLVSDSNSFEVADKLGPLYPKTGMTINMTSQNQLRFEWQKRDGVQSYIIHIYSELDGEKKQILQKSTSSNNFILDEIEILDKGRFSWEIYYSKSGKKEKEFSSTFQIDLDPLPEKIELLTPKVQYAD